MEKILIGKVISFISGINVAIIELMHDIKLGEHIAIENDSGLVLKQKVFSMEIENTPIEEAFLGQSIGLKVKDEVKPSDKVFLLIE